MNPIIESSIIFLREIFEAILTKFIIAVLILLIGFSLGKIVGRLIEKGLEELNTNKVVKKIFKTRIPLEQMMSSLVEYIIYFVSIVQALRHLGWVTDIVNIFSGILIVLLIIIIVLAIKDFIPNAIAGIRIHFKKYFKEGDVIQVETIRGKVIELGLLETRLITKTDDHIFIPNAFITKKGMKRLKKNAL